MNWKPYKHELILVVMILFAAAAFFYKSSQHAAMASGNQKMAQEIAIVEEVASLQKIWADKRIPKKLETIRSIVSSSKIQWQKKGRKLAIYFRGLSPSEVNKVVTKLLNIPIQIEKVKVEKNGETYTMEIRCKW